MMTFESKPGAFLAQNRLNYFSQNGIDAPEFLVLSNTQRLPKPIPRKCECGGIPFVAKKEDEGRIQFTATCEYCDNKARSHTSTILALLNWNLASFTQPARNIDQVNFPNIDLDQISIKEACRHLRELRTKVYDMKDKAANLKMTGKERQSLAIHSMWIKDCLNQLSLLDNDLPPVASVEEQDQTTDSHFNEAENGQPREADNMSTRLDPESSPADAAKGEVAPVRTAISSMNDIIGPLSRFSTHLRSLGGVLYFKIGNTHRSLNNDPITKFTLPKGIRVKQDSDGMTLFSAAKPNSTETTKITATGNVFDDAITAIETLMELYQKASDGNEADNIPRYRKIDILENGDPATDGIALRQSNIALTISMGVSSINYQTYFYYHRGNAARTVTFSSLYEALDTAYRLRALAKHYRFNNTFPHGVPVKFNDLPVSTQTDIIGVLVEAEQNETLDTSDLAIGLPKLNPTLYTGFLHKAELIDLPDDSEALHDTVEYQLISARKPKGHLAKPATHCGTSRNNVKVLNIETIMDTNLAEAIYSGVKLEPHEPTLPVLLGTSALRLTKDFIHNKKVTTKVPEAIDLAKAMANKLGAEGDALTTDTAGIATTDGRHIIVESKEWNDSPAAAAIWAQVLLKNRPRLATKKPYTGHEATPLAEEDGLSGQKNGKVIVQYKADTPGEDTEQTSKPSKNKGNKPRANTKDPLSLAIGLHEALSNVFIKHTGTEKIDKQTNQALIELSVQTLKSMKKPSNLQQDMTKALKDSLGENELDGEQAAMSHALSVQLENLLKSA